MLKNYKIRAPYFEIGPKCFMWGERMLKLAKAVDKIAEKYDLDVILTPQYADIRLIAENTERVHVYAQHMDSLYPGRGLGSVLPESIKDAGAVGVMLNHAEKIKAFPPKPPKPPPEAPAKPSAEPKLS